MSDVSDFHHFRINHSKLFADRHNYINGIENFWNQAKRHMRKFNGVPKKHFELFSKECGWRFNNSDPSRQLSPGKIYINSIAKIYQTILSVFDLVTLFLTKQKNGYMNDEHFLISEEIDLNERI